MTQVTKKVVLALDQEAQAYKCAGHNLSSEQEAELTGKLKTEGRIFVSFDQEEGHHRALSFHTCKICRSYAEQATREHRQAAARAQAEELTTKHAESAPSSEQEEEAASQESESD